MLLVVERSSCYESKAGKSISKAFALPEYSTKQDRYTATQLFVGSGSLAKPILEGLSSERSQQALPAPASSQSSSSSSALVSSNPAERFKARAAEVKKEAEERFWVFRIERKN